MLDRPDDNIRLIRGIIPYLFGKQFLKILQAKKTERIR